LPVRDYEGFNTTWHRRRFSVKPGITCLWQVMGRSSIPFERWMELDMQYIDQWSLLLGPSDHSQDDPRDSKRLRCLMTASCKLDTRCAIFSISSFKRKLVIAAFMLGTVVSAGVILMSYSPRMYEATTQILLSPGREHMLDLTTSSATAVPPRLSFDLDEHTARTIEMLTSKYLSEQLVETLGARTLCEEPVGFPLGLISRHFCDPRQSDEVLNEVVALQVRDNIRAERVGHAALVNLSFRHQNPIIAAKAVNTLGALYLSVHLGVLKNARSEAFVQEQAEALKQRLDQAEKNLEDFKRSNGIGSTLKDERESLTRQIALFDVQHAEILAKVAELNGRVARLQTHPRIRLAPLGSIASLREADHPATKGERHVGAAWRAQSRLDRTAQRDRTCTRIGDTRAAATAADRIERVAREASGQSA
jgi:hypothetical protein